MYQQDGIKSYRRTNVVTSDPGKLVILCYEGAIDQLELAKRKDPERAFGEEAEAVQKAGEVISERAKAIQKAGDIIDELLCSLDFEKGGVIARNLESLYNYMTRRILQAEAERNTGILDEIIGMLGELRSAWEVAIAKQSKPTQLAAAGPESGPRSDAIGRISI